MRASGEWALTGDSDDSSPMFKILPWLPTALSTKPSPDPLLLTHPASLPPVWGFALSVPAPRDGIRRALPCPQTLVVCLEQRPSHLSSSLLSIHHHHPSPGYTLCSLQVQCCFCSSFSKPRRGALDSLRHHGLSACLPGSLDNASTFPMPHPLFNTYTLNKSLFY